MSIGNIAEIVAWVISGVIAVWMLTDMVKVSRQHDEEFLTTSAEEFDEAH